RCPKGWRWKDLAESCPCTCWSGLISSRLWRKVDGTLFCAFLAYTDCRCGVTSRYARTNNRAYRKIEYACIRVTSHTTRRALWTDSLDRPSAKAPCEVRSTSK
ncbi:unnamed protein product, partial [Ectocarpus sp. 12 AP-2014]